MYGAWVPHVPIKERKAQIEQEFHCWEDALDILKVILRDWEKGLWCNLLFKRQKPTTTTFKCCHSMHGFVYQLKGSFIWNYSWTLISWTSERRKGKWTIRDTIWRLLLVGKPLMLRQIQKNLVHIWISLSQCDFYYSFTLFHLAIQWFNL